MGWPRSVFGFPGTLSSGALKFAARGGEVIPKPGRSIALSASTQTTKYCGGIAERIDADARAAPLERMDLVGHHILNGDHGTGFAVAQNGNVVQRQPYTVPIAR